MKGFSALADGLLAAELTPGEVMLLADLGMQFRSLLEAVSERARDDSTDGFHEDEAARILGSRGWGSGSAGPNGAAGSDGADGAAGGDAARGADDGFAAGEHGGSLDDGRPSSETADSSSRNSDSESSSELGFDSEFGFDSDSDSDSDSDADSDSGTFFDPDAEFRDDDGRIFADVSEGDLDPVWDDPAVRRLFPDAYPEDPEASVDFRRYTIESSTDRKLQNVEDLIASLVNGRDPEAIAATLSGADDVLVRLNPAQVQAWIRSLTDLRLTLAARLGIEEDGDEPEPTDEDAAAIFDIYDWLGWVQDSLVTALSESLPA
ncbi:DUF2017 family protein [Okibacterium fritillariae]|uniref:Uncharacterized protein n=1 Tax=Okibacterium fritillariae TaxID=123320 RepID=A0A1T5L001_9MICO|nr:DUF2017 family protein [Okibacterium fritillariae]SKC69366.1 protein of unknown function [Okibacterium fritillariae]